MHGSQTRHVAGPNTAILDDFLRMLWEKSVTTVVMLTNTFEAGKVSLISLDGGMIIISTAVVKVWRARVLRCVCVLVSAQV